MGNTSKGTPETNEALSRKEAVGELTKKTNEALSPLAYGTVNKNIEGNLEALEFELAFQKKFSDFENLVQTKARKTWAEKFAQSAGEIKDDVKDDFVRFVSDDPDVKLAFDDLVAFDQTNVNVSAGLLAATYLSGKMRRDMAKEINPGKKALAALKPVLIANIVMQPAVLGAVGSVGKNIVGKGVYNVGKVTKNALYGTVSGDLFRETMKLGKKGNPVEYLWNGKTYRQRRFDVLKNPEIYKTPQKLKAYFGPRLRKTFKAIDTYEENPEKIEPYIDHSAEFVFRSAKNSLSPVELQTFIRDMEAGVWDETMVRRATMTSASGGMLKFFLETASLQHRKAFLEKFRSFSQEKYPPKPFTDKDLEQQFPSISKRATRKEKKGIRAALSLGASGLAAGVFLLSTLLSKLLFKFGKNTFDLTDPSNGGWERFRDRAKSSFVKKKSDVKAFKEYESRRFMALLKKRDSQQAISLLGGKNGILTESEIRKINGKTISNLQRKKIAEDLESFMKDRKKISAEEFWELDSVKTLRGKNLRERE